MISHSHSEARPRSAYKRGLLIEDQRVSECSQIIAEVNQLLGQRFGLGHTTLQLECESCESSPACDLRVLQKESLTVKS